MRKIRDAAFNAILLLCVARAKGVRLKAQANLCCCRPLQDAVAGYLCVFALVVAYKFFTFFARTRNEANTKH